jgi:hypothetical protein
MPAFWRFAHARPQTCCDPSLIITIITSLSTALLHLGWKLPPMESSSSAGFKPAALLPLAPSQLAEDSGTILTMDSDDGDHRQNPIDPDHDPIKAASSTPADKSVTLPTRNLHHRRRRDSLIDMWCLLHVFALLYAANVYGDCC